MNPFELRSMTVVSVAFEPPLPRRESLAPMQDYYKSATPP
jgi:hypothetical protein